MVNKSFVLATYCRDGW